MNVEHARGIPSLRSVVPRGDPEPSFINPDSGAYHIDKNQRGEYFTCSDSVKHTPIKYRASLASTMPLGGLPGCGSHSNPISMTYLRGERVSCYANTPLMNRILDKRYDVKGQDIMDSTLFSYVNCFSTAVDRDDPVKNKSFHLGPGCYKATEAKDKLATNYRCGNLSSERKLDFVCLLADSFSHTIPSALYGTTPGRVIKFEVADKGPDMMVNPNVNDLAYDTARYFRGELENKPCIRFNDVPRDTGMGKKGWGPHCLTSNVGPWNDIDAWQKPVSIHHRGVPQRPKMPREGPGGDGSGYTDRPPFVKSERRPVTTDAPTRQRSGSKDADGSEGSVPAEGSRPNSKISASARQLPPASPLVRRESLSSMGVSTKDLRALEEWKRSRRKGPKRAPKPKGEVPVPAMSAYKPKNLG